MALFNMRKNNVLKNFYINVKAKYKLYNVCLLVLVVLNLFSTFQYSILARSILVKWIVIVLWKKEHKQYDKVWWGRRECQDTLLLDIVMLQHWKGSRILMALHKTAATIQQRSHLASQEMEATWRYERSPAGMPDCQMHDSNQQDNLLTTCPLGFLKMCKEGTAGDWRPVLEEWEALVIMRSSLGYVHVNLFNPDYYNTSKAMSVTLYLVLSACQVIW